MAASPRPLLLQRYRDLYVSTPSLLLLTLPHPPPPHTHRLRRPLRPCLLSIAACLASGFDGGGVAGDIYLPYPGCRKGEFSTLASVLRRIEPLDTSVIGKSVSAVARDSMKQTVSTMLGLLPPISSMSRLGFPTGPSATCLSLPSSPGTRCEMQAVKVASGESEMVREEGSWMEEWEGVGCSVEVMDMRVLVNCQRRLRAIYRSWRKNWWLLRRASDDKYAW